MESKVIEDGYFKVYKDGTIYGLNSKGYYVRKTPTVNTTNSNKKYNYVSAYKKGHGQRHAKVDRLIAKAFIPNPNNKKIVTHIDGDSLNDSIENLTWVTPKEMTMLMKNRGNGVSLENNGVPCFECGELTMAKDCICRNCKAVLKIEKSLERKKEKEKERFKNVDMSILNIREKYVIEQRLEGATLEGIGDALGITREGVRRIETRIIAKHNDRKRVLAKIHKNGIDLMELDCLELALNKTKTELAALLGMSIQKYSILLKQPEKLTIKELLIIQKESQKVLGVKKLRVGEENLLRIENLRS